MELYDLNITVGELLENPAAKDILMREFPKLAGSPIVKLYQDISIKQILAFTKGKVSDSKIRELIKEIEMI